MKTYQYKLITLILLLTPFFVSGQVTKIKEIKKQYNVSANGKLSVDGKYGDVHIETWSKNTVVVEIKIEVTKRSEAKALEYLDKITIDIDDASSNNLSFKTRIDGSLNNSRNEKVKINYLIKVPESLNMNLKNNYGNLYLQETSGKITLSVAYGNMKVDDISGLLDLKLSYGNGEMNKVSDGNIVVRYSNLEIEDAGNIDVTNSYSNIDFGTAKDVDLSNKYGNLSWSSLNSLEGYSKYGNVKIAKLYESIDFDLTYGGGLKVAWISKDFSKINIESSYSAISLYFEQGMSAMLDAELKYCDLKNYDIDFDHSYIDERGSMKSYRGKLGNGSYTSKINISSSYHSVKIGYAD